MKLNFNIDWSQGSTQRAAIVLPFAVIAVGLVLAGNTAGGLAVMGMVQTVYHALGIAISDSRKED